MEYLLITGVLLVLSVALTMDFSWNNVLGAVRNELVFEGRNQEYGAFVLRRDYVKRLMIAVAASVAFLGLTIGTPKIIEALGGGEEEVAEAKKIVDVNLELFEEEKKEEPPPPPVEIPPPPKSDRKGGQIQSPPKLLIRSIEKKRPLEKWRDSMLFGASILQRFRQRFQSRKYREGLKVCQRPQALPLL